MSSRRAAILAGGLGTRLRPVIADRPKVLAPVAGRPFVTYLLDQLGRAGVKEAILCTGYFASAVRETLGTQYQGMRLTYSEEPEPLGTAGALRHALSKLGDESIWIANGDSLCPADLTAMAELHGQRGARGTMLLSEAADTSRFGRIELDSKGRIARFVEKGGAAGRGWVNAGIYLLGTEWLAEIPEGRPVSLEREMFPKWTDGRLWGHPVSVPLLDIGTPESYAQAERFLLPLAPTRT